MSEIEQFERTNCFPNQRIVALTFDDGRRDNYNFLLPLAKEFEIKANLGIIANRISRDPDNRIDSFMTYQEINEMKNSGWFEIH
jgi:peptidoglycan/xylan/chitin deacetylase (PgdA/CDA1 family)